MYSLHRIRKILIREVLFASCHKLGVPNLSYLNVSIGQPQSHLLVATIKTFYRKRGQSTINV
jgi:hypothetical protein